MSRIVSMYLIMYVPFVSCSVLKFRAAVFNATRYTMSAGVANNRMLSKVASPMNKPDGVAIIATSLLPNLFQTLAVNKIRGIGGKLGTKFEGKCEPRNVKKLGKSILSVCNFEIGVCLLNTSDLEV